MKTALSVPDDLFREIEKVAKAHHYSRSEVFVIAVREYLERLRSKKLLFALNNAYASAESPGEYNVREKSKKRYGKTDIKEYF